MKISLIARKVNLSRNEDRYYLYLLALCHRRTTSIRRERNRKERNLSLPVKEKGGKKERKEKKEKREEKRKYRSKQEEYD